MDEKKLLGIQKDEITAYVVYRKIALQQKDVHNRDLLNQIAADEMKHYAVLKSYTKQEVAPNRWKVFKFSFLSRVLGLTFGVKLLEKDETEAQSVYREADGYEVLQRIAEDEERHENQLIGMINEERLEYMGSVVLGLNDALVEFTGALAGFTLALSSTPLIALTGSITGIAAALSMASSEYLSTKSDGDGTKHPVKASVYTGIAYLFTVAVLVAPFILFENAILALGVMLVCALLIIAAFNYYYSVARSESFRKRFVEMALLSFGVATVSFLIGYGLKALTGVEA